MALMRAWPITQATGSSWRDSDDLPSRRSPKPGRNHPSVMLTVDFIITCISMKKVNRAWSALGGWPGEEEIHMWPTAEAGGRGGGLSASTRRPPSLKPFPLKIQFLITSVDFPTRHPLQIKAGPLKSPSAAGCTNSNASAITHPQNSAPRLMSFAHQPKEQSVKQPPDPGWHRVARFGLRARHAAARAGCGRNRPEALTRRHLAVPR